MNRESDIVRAILAQCKIELPDHEANVTRIAEVVKRRGGRPILPRQDESLAVSTMRPKTAALAFDRVLRLPGSIDPMPEEIGFYCATLPEMITWVFLLMHISLISSGVDIPDLAPLPGTDIAANEERSLRELCSELEPIMGSTPTIFYESASRRDREFPYGAKEILVAAISDCSLVDESALSWGQVLDFRRDAEARKKYRRLVRWIDTEIAARSPQETRDLIAIRLDDYGWAMKKHGLQAAIGSLSSILDPRFLGGISATVAASAVAGGPTWAAIAGTGISVGRVLLTLGTAYVDGIDERRKTNYEVAYLYDVGKLG